MKLETNMYVRTKDGIITKIIDNRDNVIIKTDDYTTHLRSKVIKASYNIIDLIEVGDYVNGSLVIEIRDYTDDNIKRIATERSAMYSVTIREDELLNNLKSIVTKEQFESMSYKVGE